ncbi:TonB-dependent receptor plug domain-containing protein [Azospirillum picis]|uniref:Vitamin B12 transporter n=1 Tax=Azospirillum picis TaxID=488438 RepID=A0ABU0MI43_9PROT|nr:TonB-dependent receptor [Azospirillum picis]MBP2299275.1 vitamin B12 transporter [Azospirillum picis]MDQ0533087.1 vitamin B12 transporter [Azospirillum picis]
MRNSIISLFRGIAPALFLPALCAASDPADAQEVRLDRLPVGAPAPAPTAAEVAQDRATAAASEVTADEIRQQQINRLDDALRLVPGLTLSGRQAPGGAETLSIRGLGPRNTRVFIDGIEMSDTSQSQSQYPMGEFATGDIERIEVLRGPQPGRFGPDTGGGVIDITTKRPTEPLAGTAGAEYGADDTWRGNASVSGLNDRLDYRLSLAGTRSGGYSDFSKERGGVEKDPFRQWSAAGRIGLQATDGLRLDATARYQRKHLTYDADDRDVDWSRDETERFVRVGGRLDSLGGRLVHGFGIANSLVTRRYRGEGTKDDTYDGHKTRLDYGATAALSDTVTLGYGADATRESMQQHTPGFAPLAPDMDSHTWRGGAFATAGVTPLPALDLSATLRGDRHSAFGGRGTWRLGAAYTVGASGTTLRSSYGTAWQPPSLYERFDPCYGRSDLRPERSRGWDAGIEQSLFGGGLTAGATWFQASTRDQIDWVYSPPSGGACSGGGYVNTSRTRARGLELELTARPTATIDLRAAYTWQDVIDADSRERIRSRPLHQGTAVVGWRFRPDAHASLGLRYRGVTAGYSGESDAFLTADLRLSYALTENLTLQGRVENLFDRRYEEIRGHATPGRSGYAGLSARF